MVEIEYGSGSQRIELPPDRDRLTPRQSVGAWDKLLRESLDGLPAD